VVGVDLFGETRAFGIQRTAVSREDGRPEGRSQLHRYDGVLAFVPFHSSALKRRPTEVSFRV
jgi:hypothetical protein